MELFDLPPQPGQRLDSETHAAVFGELPSSLAVALHTPEIGDLVLQLLDCGWRRGQLAARVGAMPAGPDPVAEVTGLLEGFLEQVPPDARWRAEKTEREAQRQSTLEFEKPASEESRSAWISQIRDDLGTRAAQRSRDRARVRDREGVGRGAGRHPVRVGRRCGGRQG